LGDFYSHKYAGHATHVETADTSRSAGAAYTATVGGSCAPDT